MSSHSSTNSFPDPPLGPDSELWIRRLIDQLPAILWTTDRNLVCTAVLGSGLKLLGPRAERFVGMSVRDYCGQDETIPQLRDHLRALRGEVVDADHVWEGRTWRGHVAPLHDPAGAIVGCMGVSLDITDRVAAEQELRIASERLADLSQHVPGLMYQTLASPRGEDLGVPYMSARAREFLGAEPEEVIANPAILYDAVHLEDRPEFHRRAALSLAQLSPFQFECRVISRAGEERWMHVTSQPRKLANGNILSNGLAIDITVRRNADAEIQRLNAELEARVATRTQESTEAQRRASDAQLFIESVAEAAPAILFVYDLDEKRNIFTNRKFADLLGVPREEAERAGTRFFEDHFHPDDAAAIAQAHRNYACAADGEVIVTEYRLRHANGEWRWFRNADTVFKRHADGSPRQVLGLAQDITEHKRALDTIKEEQRLLRKLLELQTRERRMMAYEIHDGFVQQLIAAQMHLAGLAAMELQLPADALKELEATQRLVGQSISEVRRFIGDLRPMVIEDRGLIEALDDLVQDTAATLGIPIEFSHQVQFDRLQAELEGNLFRIAQEALNNVKRHSRATKASVALAQEGSWLTMTILDNGIGFHPAHVPAERFGLEGIRERSRLFGGAAEITSSPGRGTTVRVRLPLEMPSK